MIYEDEMKELFERGLSGGSVNNPETSSYHLEVFSLYEDHSEGITQLMNEYELNASILNVKRKYCIFKRSGKDLRLS